MTSALEKKLDNIEITKSMLDNLDYDKGTENISKMTSTSSNGPLALIVFHQSDLDAASYYLAKSLEDPLSNSAIKCAFIQESCVEKFTAKLKSKLKPYSEEALKNKSLSSALEKSSEIILKLSAKTIRSDAKETQGPIVVCDIPQEYFSNDGPSPVVTLYTFRTVKEAIALSKKESSLKSASIWSENHATAYEVITATSLGDYYLNCCNVAWDPIKEYIVKREPFVVIEKSYHYETLMVSGVQKNIVFPFGTSFAN